jgi:hypothetical protein
MSEGAWRISPGSDHQRFNAAGCWGQNRWWQLCDLNLVEEVAPDWHWRKRFLGVCERQIVNQSGGEVLATSFFNGFSFTVANEPDFDSRFWESGGSGRIACADSESRHPKGVCRSTNQL